MTFYEFANITITLIATSTLLQLMNILPVVHQAKLRIDILPKTCHTTISLITVYSTSIKQTLY